MSNGVQLRNKDNDKYWSSTQDALYGGENEVKGQARIKENKHTLKAQ